MASTYSANLRLELIGTGEQQGTWGATTNTNLGTLLEEAIGGYASITVSDAGDTTLTTANGSTDQARNMVLNLAGTLTNTRNVICPAIEKLYIVKNATTGGYAVTFKVSGQTGVSIPNGSTYLLYVDGTDVREVTGSIASQAASNVAITGGSITGLSSLGTTNIELGHASDTTFTRVSAGVAAVEGKNIALNGTGETFTTGTIELGAASDTTISRSSAGIIAVEGVTVPLNSITNTHTAQQIELGHASDTTLTRVSAGVVAIEGTNIVKAGAATSSGLTMATSRLLGRTTASTGAIEEISVGTGLTLSGGSLTSSATGALLRAPQIKTSGTSYTTPAGCTSIYVECVGGGGGGGGADNGSTGLSAGGSGGGAGAYCAKYFTVTANTSYTYAIGGGGGGGSNTGGTGSSGGNTTFTVGGTTITAGGGAGGPGCVGSNSSDGGVGGTATLGDINITGNGGGSGLGCANNSVLSVHSGAGGGSFFGGGAEGRSSSNGAGFAGESGGGGSGAFTSVTTGYTGGSGGDGLIRIWEFS